MKNERILIMKVIVFDMDDTLYDQMMPFRQAYKQIFGNRFDVNVDKLFQLSRKHSDELFLPSQRGEISMEEVFIYRIQKAFEDMNIAITDDEALQFQKLYEYGQAHIEMREKIPEILTVCKKKKKLGLISNGPSEHQWNKIKQLGVLEWIEREHIFISADLNMAKPDAAIFLYVSDYFKVKPEQCLYIGDNYYNDVVGAKNAGWKVIWLNQHNYKIPEGGVLPDDICRTEAELFQYCVKLCL